MLRDRKSREPGGAIAAGNGSDASIGAPSVTVYHPSSGKSTIRVGGHVVGVVVADVFHKNVRAAAHQLQKPRAWCWDVQSLADAENAGAKFCELHDDQGKTWRASIAKIRARGFPVNRGFGAQVGLALDQFNKADQGEPVAAQLAFSWGAP